MIEYSLLESGIFQVNLSGTVTRNDIKDYLLDFSQIDNLPVDLKIFYDLRKVRMNLGFKDILFISKLSKRATYRYQIVRTALLVDTPKITAYSILFSSLLTSKKTYRKVFSTEKAAYKWLI